MEKMICLESSQDFDFNKNSFTICNKCNSISDYFLTQRNTCCYCIKSNHLIGRKLNIICFDIKSIILYYFKKNNNKKSEIKFKKIEESLELLTEAFKYGWYSKSNMCWYFGSNNKNISKIELKILQIIKYFYSENCPDQKYKSYSTIKNIVSNIKDKTEMFTKISAPNPEILVETEVSFPPENLNRNIFLKNLRENLNFWKFD
jgi:hypothetical protein